MIDPVLENTMREYKIVRDDRELHFPDDQVWRERQKWAKMVGDLLARLGIASDV